MFAGDISAIILAGGHSSRMGKNKAKLIMNGNTMLEIQVNKCRAIGINDIIISGSDLSIPGTRLTPDLIADKGPLSGIHAGLKASEKKACLVLGVDIPLVTPAILLELVNMHSEGITVLNNNGKLEPLVSVIDSQLAESVEKILNSEHTSVMHFISSFNVKHYEFQGEKELLINCNTPEEFEQALNIAKKQHK